MPVKKTKRKKKASRQKKLLRLEYVEAGSLKANPMNWRRHPTGQADALKAVIGDVGWAGALLYNEATGQLIDGHARKDAVPAKTLVPVLIGSWTPAQEMKILATLDPLAAMADTDPDALESLMAEIDLTDEGLSEIVGYLDKLISQPTAPIGGDEPDGDELDEPGESRKRGERTACFVIGGLKFEIPRPEFDAWLISIEDKVGNDPDRVIREIKRRLKIKK